MNLRSLHDTSYVHCSKAEIIVTENFSKCRIFDQKKHEYCKTTEAEIDGLPELKVMADEEL